MVSEFFTVTAALLQGHLFILNKRLFYKEVTWREQNLLTTYVEMLLKRGANGEL